MPSAASPEIFVANGERVGKRSATHRPLLEVDNVYRKRMFVDFGAFSLGEGPPRKGSTHSASQVGGSGRQRGEKSYRHVFFGGWTLPVGTASVDVVHTARWRQARSEQGLACIGLVRKGSVLMGEWAVAAQRVRQERPPSGTVPPREFIPTVSLAQPLHLPRGSPNVTHCATRVPLWSRILE